MALPAEIRVMTDTFRVQSDDLTPLLQIPPQLGFPTVQRPDLRVPVRDDQGHEIGVLYPLPNPHVDLKLRSALRGTTAVCIVTQSHSLHTTMPEIRSRTFPEAGLDPFLCAVSYGVKIGERTFEALVTGSRMVSLGEPYRDKEDGRRAVDVEIIEMYLVGFDSTGSMITVRGGRRFGLPALPGRIKALGAEADFPASIYFDLQLQISYWGGRPGA